MKRVGVIFGGLSNEAEVSVLSARNVLSQLDPTRFEAVAIYWRRDGSFARVPDVDHREQGETIHIEQIADIVDVVFPVTHGKFGEDGILQGMLEAQRIPYCGCGVLSSALCMDKAALKMLTGAADIHQTSYAVLDYAGDSEEHIASVIERARRELAMPWFIKPANSGSSVGITRVEEQAQLDAAINVAREHDTKVLIEQGVMGAMEIEVSVLGNRNLVVSPPGQIIPSREFYDYEDKYIVGASRSVIPAPLDVSVAMKVRKIAEQAYRLAGCRGFARVDFFVRDGEVFLNEINTLPGFTDISMYPKLMEATDISYRELLSRIIELAFEH